MIFHQVVGVDCWLIMEPATFSFDQHNSLVTERRSGLWSSHLKLHLIMISLRGLVFNKGGLSNLTKESWVTQPLSPICHGTKITREALTAFAPLYDFLHSFFL